MKNKLFRINDIFELKNQKYINEGYDIYELFIFSQMLRKELLSDILELENKISDLINREFDFTKRTYKELKQYCDYKKGLITQNNKPKYYKIFDQEISNPHLLMSCLYPDHQVKLNKNDKDYNFKKSKLDERLKKPIAQIIREIHFGGLIRLINDLDKIKIKRSLDFLFIANKKSTGKKDIDSIYLPNMLKFIKCLRNYFAHNDVNLNEKKLFGIIHHSESWKGQKNMKWFIERLSLILNELHGKNFYERFIDKLENNHLLDNEKLKQITDNQTHWKNL